MRKTISPRGNRLMPAQLMSGPARFVLGGSGHIAGIINRPLKNKYHYWTNDRLTEDPADWLQAAQAQRGLMVAGLADWARDRPQESAAREPGKSSSPLKPRPAAM